MCTTRSRRLLRKLVWTLQGINELIALILMILTFFDFLFCS